jgi:hypothetical protein
VHGNASEGSEGTLPCTRWRFGLIGLARLGHGRSVRQNPLAHPVSGLVPLRSSRLPDRQPSGRTARPPAVITRAAHSPP